MEIEGLSSKSENVQRKLHSSAQGQTQPKVELFFESKRQKLSFALGKKGGGRKVGEHAEMEEKGTGTEIKTAK